MSWRRMKVGKISDMNRGWMIGNFEPSLLKTDLFEVGVLLHPKGHLWPAHYHLVATEYNLLISGSMNVCGEELRAGDTFIIEPGEIAEPTFYEDCTIMCVKVPGTAGDKYLVKS